MRDCVGINQRNNGGSVWLWSAVLDADGFMEIIGCMCLIAVRYTCVHRPPARN